MVDAISIQNITSNIVITLNRLDAQFLLDDNSPDFGTINANDITYPLLSTYIGVGVSKTTLNQPRQITITGWICNDAQGTIEAKKRILNTFCNPFDLLKITCKEYTITGHMEQPILYPSNSALNNDCLCKFTMYITCPFPLFAKELETIKNTGAVNKNFIFPLVLTAPKGFVFGERTKTNEMVINNVGTVETGFVVEISTTSTVKGLSFTINNQTLKLKDSYSLTSGKSVKISTVGGSRGIWLKIGNNAYVPAFEILDLSSDWLQLSVGLNTITLNCSEGSLTYVDISMFVNCLYYAMEDQ